MGDALGLESDMKLIKRKEVGEDVNHDDNRSSNEFSVNIIPPIIHNLALNELTECKAEK